MNIKSLLLGSAAALVAVSGARAADAIIAEPEPVEYVRVCDAYGAGFFYIPGTETCLQISGYVWYQIAANGFDTLALGAEPGDVLPYYGRSVDAANAVIPEGWYKTTRARVNFDARSETEWGTLRGYIRYQADWGSIADGAVTTDQAFLELGGLRMGYTESAWAYANKGGVSGGGSHTWGGLYYGYQQRHQISYTFQGGNGFHATVSLEDDALAGDGYMPDVVAVVGINQGWGGVWAKVGYDESFDGSAFPVAYGAGFNDGGWGAQVGVHWNVPNMPGSSLRVIGYWADGAHAYNVGGPSTRWGGAAYTIYGGSEWSVLASYKHQFTPELSASVGVQWFNDLYFGGTDVSSGVDAWAAELGVIWTPVTNFEVRLEAVYADVDAYPAGLAVSGDPDGTWSGFLRFTRYF